MNDSADSPSSTEIVASWRAGGRAFEAGGVKSFVSESGEGEPVLCLHGVPASSFLYRKVLDELASREMHGIAFDLPGLGLADRPADFDYTWTGLGRFSIAAADELGLERFHLVVHDVGGPVGFELAAALPDRIASITVLNTIVDAADFKRPWSMEPFAHRGLGELYLRMLSKPAFRLLMRSQGIENMAAVSPAELDAYVDLLKMGDGGRAFLKIMQGFQRTAEKQALYRSVLADERYPVAVLWGANDPALKASGAGDIARRAAGLDRLETVPAKHFLQEDQAPAVAEHIVRNARRAAAPPLS
jgi:haloalkane dehalogenase